MASRGSTSVFWLNPMASSGRASAFWLHPIASRGSAAVFWFNPITAALARALARTFTTVPLARGGWWWRSAGGGAPTDKKVSKVSPKSLGRFEVSGGIPSVEGVARERLNYSTVLLDLKSRASRGSTSAFFWLHPMASRGPTSVFFLNSRASRGLSSPRSAWDRSEFEEEEVHTNT